MYFIENIVISDTAKYSCVDFQPAKMLRRKLRDDKTNKASISKIMYNTDFVLDNFLEAEVKAILLPLYVAQCFSLAPKYSIRDSFITSNGYKFNTFVFMLAIVIGMLWFYVVPNLLTKTVGLLTASVYVYSITIAVALILNAFITTRQSNINAHLIILLQRIQKRFTFVKFHYKGISMINWLFLISLSAYNVAHLGTRISESDESIFKKILAHLIYISIDCNNVITIRMIHWLGKLIETWISELKYFCRENCFDIEAKDCMNKIIKGYDELIEALDVCNKVFRVPVNIALFVTLFSLLITFVLKIVSPYRFSLWCCRLFFKFLSMSKLVSL